MGEGGRTVEDRLREEYFDLLPDIRRVANELEAEVKHSLVPISRGLATYERLVVTSRIKECESAVDSLRRRQESATFDSDRPELYALNRLNDLAGVRVLCFPRSRLAEADRELRNRFPTWTADPLPGYDDDDEPLALKYYGYCHASKKIAPNSRSYRCSRLILGGGTFRDLQAGSAIERRRSIAGDATTHKRRNQRPHGFRRRIRKSGSARPVDREMTPETLSRNRPNRGVCLFHNIQLQNEPNEMALCPHQHAEARLQFARLDAPRFPASLRARDIGRQHNAAARCRIGSPIKRRID